jgi:hypothetical protein
MKFCPFFDKFSACSAYPVGFCVYDICISIVVLKGADIGKISQVWKSTNFDAGLYDITGFLWALIFSIYLFFVDILVSGK